MIIRRRTAAAAFAMCLTLLALTHAAEARTTFTKDVAPIFYTRCVECHRPTMFAPMSLMTYEAARPWARSIKQRVVSRACRRGVPTPRTALQERPAPDPARDRHHRGVGRRRDSQGR